MPFLKTPLFKIQNKGLRYLAGLLTIVAGAAAGAAAATGVLYGLGFIFLKIFDAAATQSLEHYFSFGFCALVIIIFAGLIGYLLYWAAEEVGDKLFSKIENEKKRRLSGALVMAPYGAYYAVYAIFYLGFYKGAKAIGEKFYDP